MPPMASTSMSTTARSTATSSGCARSSRPSTRNSRRSKPSMASAIDTATAEAPGPAAAPSAPPGVAPPAAPAALGTGPGADAGWSSDDEARAEAIADASHVGPRSWRFHWPSVSPLTRRIVAVKVLPLALLAVGFLYLGKFEASLVGQQIESLHTQGEIFGGGLRGGGGVDWSDEGEVLLPDLARQMMRRLVEPTRTHARLFDTKGRLVADSNLLRGQGDAAVVAELPEPEQKSWLPRLADWIYDSITAWVPSRHKHPVYRAADTADPYSEAMPALRADSGSMVRSDPKTRGLVISVAVPLQRYKQVLGAVLLSTSDREIQAELRTPSPTSTIPPNSAG